MITVVQAAEIAERLWQRDPLAFLAICAGAKSRGMTLLERIQARAVELRPHRCDADCASDRVPCEAVS